MPTLNLPVHSYSLAARNVAVERLVNCYAEVAPQEGKGPTSLRRASGIAVGATLSGLGRGLYRFRDNLYAVAGNTLYSITANHLATSIGTISGSAVCTFAANPTQMVVCDPLASYVYDGNLNRITDPNFGNGTQCGAVDSYIVFIGTGGKFFGSALSQATSYDALNFATAEGSPDTTIGLIVDHRQVLLFGTDSLEIWQDVGGTGFPFARASNGFIEIGCAAGYSVAKADNTIFWVANDLTVRRLDGSTPIRISQHGVEEAIGSYAKTSIVSDARGFGYTERGHIFYVLTFPTAGHTWVFDATTREWHERESFGLTRWRPCATAFCYGRNYVQDYQTGAVGYLDSKTFTDWGATQVMSWTYPQIYQSGQILYHQSLSVRVDTGLGTAKGQGSNPKIQLECSENGQLFTHVEDLLLGVQGDFGERVSWEQLGSGDDRVYRNSVSDPVPVTVADAQLVLT